MAETVIKKKRGVLCRDEMGDVLIDSDGFVQCVIEDGRLLQIKYDEIDFSTNILNFVVDDVQILVDLYKERITEIDETHELENEDYNKNKATTDVTNFDWDNASTKLFLNIYKCKKDLVSARKIKTYKLLWKQIAEDMDRNGYSVSPLQVENKFKSLTRSYKNMISNNKKTGRGRATCKFEAELTDLFAKKHNITPLALSGRNGLVIREDQNSEKENNALFNYSANNNIIENDLDEPSSVVGTSANASNTLEKDKNPQKKFRASRTTENDLDEPSCNVAGTVIASNTSEKNKNSKKMKSRARRTTTENLKECLVAIESFTSEMKTERERFHNIQVQMLEEYKNIKKLHEDYINSATERWAAASAQREERNKLLKEISKNCSDKEIFL